jgi:hypothetical protein
MLNAPTPLLIGMSVGTLQQSCDVRVVEITLEKYCEVGSKCRQELRHKPAILKKVTDIDAMTAEKLLLKEPHIFDETITVLPDCKKGRSAAGECRLHPLHERERWIMIQPQALQHLVHRKVR